MATIATLMVSLGMNTAKFESGAKRSRTSLADMAQGAVALNSVIGIANAAGGAISSMYRTFAEQSAKIDSTGKLSDRLGFKTEDLVALQHGASLADVGAEQLTTALEKMTVNIGKAKKGGELGKMFQGLGLDSKKLINTSPMTALGEIADALNDVGSTAERNAAAVQIFGKSGAEMLTLLQGGSAGLAEMREEADKLGITFDRFGAEQVARANDAMTRLNNIWTGVKQQVVIGLAPALEGAGTILKHFHENVMSGNVLFAYADAVRAANNELNTLQDKGTALKKLVKPDAPKPVDEAQNLFDKLSNRMNAARTSSIFLTYCCNGDNPCSNNLFRSS